MQLEALQTSETNGKNNSFVSSQKFPSRRRIFTALSDGSLHECLNANKKIKFSKGPGKGRECFSYFLSRFLPGRTPRTTPPSDAHLFIAPAFCYPGVLDHVTFSHLVSLLFAT